MSLSTFESASIADVFVTTRAAEADATLAMVDALAALHLEPLRRAYEVDAAERHEAFLLLVAAQITQRGYALHGFDLAFERRAQLRHRIH